MREFLTDIALPTIGYFLGLALCLGLVGFEICVAADLISNPVEMASEDAQ